MKEILEMKRTHDRMVKKREEKINQAKTDGTVWIVQQSVNKDVKKLFYQ